ncbi:hypothetical protein EDD29_0055 [Actinocorallia herbida]|uniref:Phage-related minor tail protein n=1 Tax=Actinocorallia herbida TaxID=58109 RepID=A0A3N1CMZ4_9ACTN|nr:hypothetical protein [Actinocorallia herbida]ROO82575.1 hypothetical protein EDD29_0055 [Actinocorallia herbida]
MAPTADRSVRVVLRAETAQFRREIRAAGDEVDRLERKLRDLPDPRVRVTVDVDDKSSDELRTLQQRLRAWETQHGKIKIKVELEDQIDRTLGRVEAKLERLRAMGATTIKVDLDNQTEPELSEIVAKVQYLRRQTRIRIRVDRAPHGDLDAASRQLADWTSAMERRLQIRPRLGSSFGDGNSGGGFSGGGGGQAAQIAAAVAVAYPAISTAVAGLVTFAFGAALAAIPTLAWKGSDGVREAYSDLWRDIRGGIREITPMWEAEVAGWTSIVRHMGSLWKPELASIFESIRPATSSFLQDFGTATVALKPMFRDLADGFVALLGDLSQQMPAILATWGEAIGALGRAIRDNPAMFGALLQDLGDVVQSITLLGAAAVEAYPAFKMWFDLLSVFNTVLGSSLGPLGTFASLFGNLGRELLAFSTGPIGTVFNAFLRLGESLDSSSVSSGQAATTIHDLGMEMLNLPQATDPLITSLELASLSAADLKKRLDDLVSGPISEKESLIAFQRAIDAMSESLKKNGKAHDYSVKGMANWDGLLKIAKTAHEATLALSANKATTAELAAHFRAARKAIIDAAMGMDYSRKQANELADELIGVSAAINKIDKNVDIKVTADTSGVIAEGQAALDYLNNLYATIPVAPAKPNADGNIYGYANGGEHHVAQIAQAGAMRLWAEPETGGEAYIPLSPAKRSRSTSILATVADRFGLDLVRPMAQGGLLTAYAAGGLTQTDISLASLLGDWRGVVNPSTADELEQALENRKSRQEAVSDSIGGLAEAQKARQQEIRDASRNLTEVRKDRRDTMRDARQRVADAERDLKRTRQDQADAIKDAETALKRAKKEKDKQAIKDAEKDLKRTKRDAKEAIADAKRGVSEAKRDRTTANEESLARLEAAEQRLRDSRSKASYEQVREAEERIRDARVDLAEATAALLDVEDRRKFDLMRPTDQLSAALAMGITNTGAFIANLTTLADRGFGNLAQQLLATGGAEAEKMAADAVTLSNGQLGALQGQIEQRQQQQAQLSLMPESLPVRAAIRSGQGGSWMQLLESTGLDPGTLAEVLHAMPDVAGPNLMADMAAHGYARGGWVAGPDGIDRVPAMLTRKEFVVNAGAASRHAPYLEAINSGMPAPKRYVTGGWAGGVRGSDGAAALPSTTVEQHFHEIPFSPSAMAREAARQAAWELR